MQPKNVFTIFLGNDKTMSLKAVYLDNGDPLDLSSCTQIDVALPNADGTFSHRLLTDDDVEITTPANLGKFTTTVPSDVSILLNPGVLQNFNVTFTMPSKIFTVQYMECLSVFENP